MATLLLYNMVFSAFYQKVMNQIYFYDLNKGILLVYYYLLSVPWHFETLNTFLK